MHQFIAAPRVGMAAALSRQPISLDDSFQDEQEMRCAYLATHSKGPALDWAALPVHSTTPAVMNNFDNYVQ